MELARSHVGAYFYLRFKGARRRCHYLLMACNTSMQIRTAHGGLFARPLRPHLAESPPFLNSSSTRSLGYTPAPPAPQQPSLTRHPRVTPATYSSTVIFSNANVTRSISLGSQTPLSSSSSVSSAHLTPVSTPFENSPTAQGTPSPAADVPWTTVVWFPPMSAGKTAAIVAATIIPVILILFGALLLSRFLWRRETTYSGELAAPSHHSQSAARGAGWQSNPNAGYGRISHTISTRSHGPFVLPLEPGQRVAADSISLRNVPQGIHERHFGDLSFLLDDSDTSVSNYDPVLGDGDSVANSRCDSDSLASRESPGGHPHYYIPSSVLDLESAGQEFVELNRRFGLQA